MSKELAAEYMRLLGRKKELLSKLLESLRRSACLLREDDVDAFDAEMAICDGIREKIDEVVYSLTRIREQASPVDLSEAGALEERINDILKQVVLARKECNDAAEQKLHAYGQQIKAVRGAQKGIEGYSSPFKKRDAVFIDAKK